MQPLALLTVTLTLLLSPAHQKLRSAIYRTHACLAHIIDAEDPAWDPTISYGGGHNVNDSYGLVQANPGTKMRSAGPDWQTNPYTQIRWGLAYARSRYGSECAGWRFRQTHGWW